MNDELGGIRFLSQLDPVGWGALSAMILLSVASWSVALAKGMQMLLLHRRERWERRAGLPLGSSPGTPWFRIRCAGASAASAIASSPPGTFLRVAQPERFVADALGGALAQEQERLERGLSTLATASSAAPFAGLFGTVWSIHDALLAVGAAGGGGLGSVAGPVGEALVMTGLGLAVAIPALLAYNILVSIQRGMLVRLEGYARARLAEMATTPQAGDGSGTRVFPREER